MKQMNYFNLFTNKINQLANKKISVDQNQIKANPKRSPSINLNKFSNINSMTQVQNLDFQISIIKISEKLRKMTVNIDATYFQMKSKPSLLRPLSIIEKPRDVQLKTDELVWDFRFLQEFSHFNQQIQLIKKRSEKLVDFSRCNQQKDYQQNKKYANQVEQLLISVKNMLQKCEFFNITLASSELLNGQSGLLNFYKYPQNFKICTLLTDVQRSLKAIEQSKDLIQTDRKFPFIGTLQKITVKQILPILKSLKENMYIPSSELFQEQLEKLNLQYDENRTLKENLLKNSYNLDDYSFSTYCQLFIYKECSTLQGLCSYFSFAKNILLDRKSGALAADHETWVAIFQTCLRLYARNPQVRENNWLEVDQILSTTFSDEEFTNFLLTENVKNFSLASLNFYIKNLNKSEQEKLMKIAEQKIMSLFDSGEAWKQAEDIVQHLDNECQNETKQKIYNRVIKLIDVIFLDDSSQDSSSSQTIDIETGLSFFIESMCKNLQVTQKIFNKTNMKLIAQTLKKEEKNQRKIRLLYHIFSEFIINSYEESDELSSYLEANQEIITQILPEIITLFNKFGYSLPKELYKMIFHSVSDIQLLCQRIWRGIAELYFVQSFEETIDMEVFHTENQAKRRIADHVVEILKELAMNNAKQHILLSETLNKQRQNREGLSSFLQFKAFKDETIFSNVLMMSTFFGEFLSLTDLTGILSEFYTPLVPDVKWKSSEQDNLTLLSFVSEQLPIDILKATYKFLKQGFTINIKNIESLSTDFWAQYFSNDPSSKITAILNEPHFSFQAYQNLHSLRLLDLVLNMINSVFDKLNEHSQKSIKELRIMYEWGIEYIKELQPHVYPILLNSVVNQFEKYSKEFDSENVERFQIYSRTKNISALDLHLSEKYHIFQTFNDFNKIGHVIGHEKASDISLLLYPCFVRKTKHIHSIQSETQTEKLLLKIIVKVFVLIENSCLQQIMNDENLNKVSKKHIQNDHYNEKAKALLEELNSILTSNETVIEEFTKKPLYKRLVSHLKLVIGKIYVPFVIKGAFQLSDDTFESSSKKLKALDHKFNIIKSSVEIIVKLDPLFEEHFAQLMQVIEEKSQKKQTKPQNDTQKPSLTPQILLKTLQLFFKCVLSNIKVRSFHIFKLIKLYLNETNTQLQSINQVIKFYIDLFYLEFISHKDYRCFNEEVRERARPVVVNNVNTNSANNNEASRCKILTPHKSKDHSGMSFADKVLSPLRKDKISLEDLKLKKHLKSTLTPLKQKQNHKSPTSRSHSPTNQPNDSDFSSTQQQIPHQLLKLITHTHTLSTVHCSCTLSMFINLFARLNYSSLPTGVEQMLTRENDKIVYIDYLIELTRKLEEKETIEAMSQRDLEILNIDVYGNLGCILKGKVSEEILREFIQLAKMTLKLNLTDETLVTMPIKLLNQRLFTKQSHKKLGSSQNISNEFTHISKFLAEFQDEPLAYELSVKSHVLKITPFVKSNIHICNLEYIVGENKSSISKKIIETNFKLIQSIMGRNAARQFLKKYEKPTIKKEILQVSVSHEAIEQMDKILVKFALMYEKLDTEKEVITVQLYFYFKKICSLLFYSPQLFSYLLTKKLVIGSKQMTFVDIMFDSLKQTLLFFSEFYIISLKINAGFCSKDQITPVLRQIHNPSQIGINQMLVKLSQRVPLNLVFEVYIKLTLLNMVESKSTSNLNALRVLNFVIKQSEKFRFRFYKFIRINVPQNEEFLKKIDEEILETLLKQLKHTTSTETNPSMFINKVELMDLCLQNLLSHTMFDYAKVRLDNKLKQTFVNSQYSIKCLQSFNCDINTLKVLEEAVEDEKSVSSGENVLDFDEMNNIDNVISETIIEQHQEEEKPKEEEGRDMSELQCNTFDNLEIVKRIVESSYSSLSLSPQSHQRPKPQPEPIKIIEFTSDLQPLSVKQTSELKQWLSLTVSKSSSSNTLTSLLLKEMQKSCQKLIGKENMSFNFQDPVYLESPNAQNEHIDIAAFAVSEASNLSSDCCIEDTSFVQNHAHNEGMIIESEDNINDEFTMCEHSSTNNDNEPLYDGICEDEVNRDGIIEEEEDNEQNENIDSNYEINTDGEIKISIVKETQVNRFKNYENEDGDAIVQMDDQDSQIDQEEEEEHQSEQILSGTDGSIAFTSSIKTLDNVDQIELQQVSQQMVPFSLPSSSNHQPPQITINSTQPRQYHYTIDNFTANEPFSHTPTNNNLSLVDTISAQLVNSVYESNEPVTKESIFCLIEEYTLNPEVLKVIKLRLKKISNSELKKVHGVTHGELREEVEREMRVRGLFFGQAINQYESISEGSLFSISRLINESFQIDQSKFYASNYKKCDKRTQQKQQIERIPQLTFEEWVNFVFIYFMKTKQTETKDNVVNGETLLLQIKNLQQLLMKLLLNKENLVLFLQVLLNLISCEKVEQAVKFFEKHVTLSESIKQSGQIFKSLSNTILNDLISKLIVNRIGLPVLFKGKWNYDNKKLIKYEFQCLISDSNLNNNRSQGEPLLEVFLRKSVELFYNHQKPPEKVDQKAQNQNQPTFVKSLTEYFKSLENFQSNEYPYYFIQDTIKLSSSQKKHTLNESILNLSYQPKLHYSLINHSKISLCESLLNTMKASSVQSLPQYEEIFYLMNYLDFETFSEFLELLIQKHKPLCEKVLDKELNLIKRFKKSAYSENMNKEKLAQVYWHMRKSSKSFLSTDHEQKQLQFFARIMSTFSGSIFLKFKQSIFKFGYGKQENKKKQKLSYLNKLLMNPSYQNRYKAIKEEIAQNQRQYLMWKLTKSTEILKEDVLPIIDKIAAEFNECLKKWETLFGELEDVFGTEREEKFILYKQCSEFYKIFLSFEMLLQEQETSMIRTMSSLKTKPSLESTRDMGITGRRRSSLKLPRVSLASSIQLNLPQPHQPVLPPQQSIPTFKSTFKSISPKFSFFSHMIDETCPQLKIHAKYSTIDSKLKLLHQKNKGGDLTIEVRRENIWQDTLPHLNEQFVDKNVKIKIVEELGLDYGGIRREWITLVVKELLNPNLGLFELSANGLAFQPSPMSYLVPNHLFHFYKFGILVGKALKENWLLEINFTKSFLKHILGYTLYVEDLEDIDPATTKSLLWILANDVGDGDLGIDFTHSYEMLGKKHTIELVENGKDVLVTEENKKDYVKKLAVYKMTEPIRQQSKAFMNGIEKVVPYQTLKLFSYKELGIYLAGMPTVDVQEMKKYTRYQGFTQQDQNVAWFWQALATYTEQQKANFLFFLTGSYKVPYGGFKENPISINKMPASKDYLPVAHTCFSVIDLPEYTSKEKLTMLLEKAITQGKGFSVS